MFRRPGKADKKSGDLVISEQFEKAVLVYEQQHFLKIYLTSRSCRSLRNVKVSQVRLPFTPVDGGKMGHAQLFPEEEMSGNGHHRDLKSETVCFF